jgi:hypothetical protein
MGGDVVPKIVGEDRVACRLHGTHGRNWREVPCQSCVDSACAWTCS